MEDRQFDTLVKSLAQTRVSRLAALRGLAAAALAGLAAVATPTADSEAKRHRKRKKAKRRRNRKANGKGKSDKEKAEERGRKKPKEFQRAGKRCDHGQPCGSLAPCTNGYCTPIACWIGGKIYYPGDLNRENVCVYCEPSLTVWTDWTGLTRDGDECFQPNDIPCRHGSGRCASGTCVNDLYPDNASCGRSNICCGGTCCASGECCGDDGACAPCGTQCLIEGVPYPNGALQTPTGCLKCDPSRSETAWSPLADNVVCGGAPDRKCCNGTCCPPGQCCVGLTCQECQCDGGGENLRKGRSTRAAAVTDCDPACTIDGQSYPDGAPNPANPCEVCDSAQDPAAWSPAPFLTKCGANLDRICCNGACCPDGTCCRPGFASCDVEWCGIVDPCPYLEGPCGCTVDGQFYAHQAVNPTNECEWCDAYWSTTAWSSRPSSVRCGAFSDRFCCEGVCCETGSCCNAAEICEVGAPGCRGCTIGGRFYFNGERNPDDPCQQCVTAESTTAWSNAPNGNVCEAVIDEDGIYWGDRVCCEGVCCPLYDCCNFSGVCEPTSPANCQ